MELDKEIIVKTAFDIYCFMVYGKYYPFTVNNLKMFFSEIEDDFKKYMKFENTDYKYFDFMTFTLEGLIRDSSSMDNTSHKQYLEYFIKQHQIPI